MWYKKYRPRKRGKESLKGMGEGRKRPGNKKHDGIMQRLNSSKIFSKMFCKKFLRRGSCFFACLLFLRSGRSVLLNAAARDCTLTIHTKTELIKIFRRKRYATEKTD